MAASTTNLRNPVDKLHSINRQKGYITPSRRDVLCPNFDGTFVKTGVADVTDTFTALCNNGDVSCDYREERLGLYLCKRYWADPTLDLEFIKRLPNVNPPLWQDGEVIINYERPFKNRTATVLMAISRMIPVKVDLGNFLVDWVEWSEREKGQWLQQYNATMNRQEILNLKNQDGRSFWYNPYHMSMTDYEHEYYVQARGGDDDMYGSIFRYDGNSFYSFEWDSGGLDVNGMAIYRNVKTSSGWTRTRLVRANVHWGDGMKYIHKVRIRVLKNRISVKVHRMSGANLVEIASMEYFDVDPTAPTAGAWGPMTYSQPDTYFWDLKYSVLDLLDPLMSPELLVEIPLSYMGNSGGVHLVSQPLNKYFTSEMYQKVLSRHGATESDVSVVEYWIQSTNVLEGVVFSTLGAMPLVTTDSAAGIAMTVFNYDGAILPFVGNLLAPIRNATYHVSDTSNIDKHLVSIKFRPQFRRIFDNATIDLNGKTLRYMPGIESGEHVITFEPPVQLEIGDTVTLTYYANDFELEYYRGEYVDTHDKIFKIEGNRLYWHHIPAYEGESNS